MANEKWADPQVEQISQLIFQHFKLLLSSFDPYFIKKRLMPGKFEILLGHEKLLNSFLSGGSFKVLEGCLP